MGFIDKPEPIVLQLYQRAAAEVPPRGRRATARCQPPDRASRAHRRRYFDPLPIWYPPFEEARSTGDDFPLHAITQRPMAMYHSWGSQNAWLRQIHSRQPLYVHRAHRRERSASRTTTGSG